MSALRFDAVTVRLGGWDVLSAASLVILAAGLALAEAWGGVTLACYADWPTSLWITALSGLAYSISLGARWVARVRRRVEAAPVNAPARRRRACWP